MLTDIESIWREEYCGGNWYDQCTQVAARSGKMWHVAPSSWWILRLISMLSINKWGFIRLQIVRYVTWAPFVMKIFTRITIQPVWLLPIEVLATSTSIGTNAWSIIVPEMEREIGWKAFVYRTPRFLNKSHDWLVEIPKKDAFVQL